MSALGAVSAVGRVRFRRFHCSYLWEDEPVQPCHSQDNNKLAAGGVRRNCSQLDVIPNPPTVDLQTDANAMLPKQIVHRN